MLKHTLNGTLFISGEMTNLGKISLKCLLFVFINVRIPFSILSENGNDDRYTDPTSVHLSSCDVREALATELNNT